MQISAEAKGGNQMIYLTAGESHGPQLTGIIEGLPAGLHIDVDAINDNLAKRQGGYGRGNRQQIEHDTVQVVGGMRHGYTLGSPLALVVKNRDHAHWSEVMDPLENDSENAQLRQLKHPRPGHADLVGGMKYGHRDLRNVLERSSARETAIRVALGSVCQQFLEQLGIKVVGYVKQLGPLVLSSEDLLDVDRIRREVEANDMRVLDQDKVSEAHELILKTKKEGDTLGGIVRIVASGLPAGLGSYIGWNTKLDAKLAFAVMGVNAIKGVSIGDGFEAATRPGSTVMDEILHEDAGWTRRTDHLGGFEGGMTNGMPVIVNAAMKPIPTLYKPLETADIETKERSKASVERSDTTALTACSIVLQSVVCLELAKAVCDEFQSSSMERLKKQIAEYREELARY